MAYIRKFELGDPFETLDALRDWCRGDNYVFWMRFANDQKPPRLMHGAFVLSWQFRMAAIQLPNLRQARVRAEWIKANPTKDTVS